MLGAQPLQNYPGGVWRRKIKLYEIIMQLNYLADIDFPKMNSQSESGGIKIQGL